MAAYTADDAAKHTDKADTPEKKAAWAKAANAAGDDEAKAVAAGNAAVEDMNGDDNGNGDTDADRAQRVAVSDGLEMLTRNVPLEMTPKSYDPETRTADAMLSTGARVRRRDWDTEFDEVPDMSPSAIRLGRLNGGAPLIDGHMFWGGLDSMLGAVVPGSARLENGKLRAKFKFSRSEKGQRVAQDLNDGIPIMVSVGYKTHREVRDESTSPQTRMAVDWEPMEVSVVPVGAEPGAGFRGAQMQRRAEPANGERTMTNESSRPGGDAGRNGANGADKGNNGADKGADTGAGANTERAAESTTYASDMVMIGRQARLDLAAVEDAIKRKITPDQFRAEIIAKMADVAAGNETRGANGEATGATGVDQHFRGYDETDGRADAMAEAMVIRVLASRRVPAITTDPQREWAKHRGLADHVTRAFRVMDEIDKPANPRVAQYLRRGWSELAAECLNYRGSIRTFRQAEDIITRAFQSTSDFPAIFANVLNKTMLARYTLQMPTYREIAVERPFNDFRPHPQIRTGEFPLPQPVTETGELKAGTSYDNREDLVVKPYGTIFTISRQMLVNDDLGAIDEILGTSGMAVIQFENNTFYAMFNSNPVLKQDGLAVFEATTHKNYIATGAEPDIGSLGQGRAMMRVQRSLSGNLIDTPPAIIMSGAKHETRLDQITAALSPTIVGAVNPFSGRLRTVVTSLITGDEWYLFCNPNMVPVFAYGFLQGASGPRIRTDEPFGYQGIRMSLEVDYGCGAIDFRGGFKNAGAPATNILGTYATVAGTAVTYSATGDMAADGEAAAATGEQPAAEHGEQPAAERSEHETGRETTHGRHRR